MEVLTTETVDNKFRSFGGSELTLSHIATGFSGPHSGPVVMKCATHEARVTAGPAVGSRFGNLSLLPVSSHQPHLAASIHSRERDQLDTFFFARYTISLSDNYILAIMSDSLIQPDDPDNVG
jgi:hypothetical protein